jgi:hypothetical protein
MEQTVKGTGAPKNAQVDNWENEFQTIPKRGTGKRNSDNEQFVNAPLDPTLVLDYTRVNAIEEAGMFARLSNEEIQSLGEDISEHGLLNRMTLWNDPETNITYLADGRNRRKAMIKRGIQLNDDHFRYFTGTKEQLLSFVISENVHRRHISRIERTFICARYFPNISADNRKRNSEKMKKIKKGKDGGKSIDSYSEASSRFNIKPTNLKKALTILNEPDGEVLAEEIVKGNMAFDKEYNRIMTFKRKLKTPKDLSSNLTKRPTDFTEPMFLKYRDLVLYGISPRTAENRVREFSSQHISDITKVAVSIPIELYDEVAKISKELGEEVSDILSDFLRLTKVGISNEDEQIEKSPKALF